MALTATQIQALIDQLYSVALQRGGIRQVEFEGRKIIYEDLDKVQEAIIFWEGELARLTGTRPRVMKHNLTRFE